MDNGKNLTWIKIDRDEYGITTNECLDRIESHLPVCVSVNHYGVTFYKVISTWDLQSRNFLKTMAIYTHYLPIPKLVV